MMVRMKSIPHETKHNAEEDYGCKLPNSTGEICPIQLVKPGHFFSVRKKLSLAFHGLREESERNKGENHQDNWTKTTSLIWQFTVSGKRKRRVT
jgi:hypothetical protein